MNKFARVVAKRSAVVLALVAGASSRAASSIDTTAIASTAADVGIVGLAVFAVYVAVAGFRWLRKVL